MGDGPSGAALAAVNVATSDSAARAISPVAMTVALSVMIAEVLSLITLTAADNAPDMPATGAAVASATEVICEIVRAFKSTLFADTLALS